MPKMPFFVTGAARSYSGAARTDGAGEEVPRGESVLFSCFSGVLKICVLSELAYRTLNNAKNTFNIQFNFSKNYSFKEILHLFF